MFISIPVHLQVETKYSKSKMTSPHLTSHKSKRTEPRMPNFLRTIQPRTTLTTTGVTTSTKGLGEGENVLTYSTELTKPVLPSPTSITIKRKASTETLRPRHSDLRESSQELQKEEAVLVVPSPPSFKDYDPFSKINPNRRTSSPLPGLHIRSPIPSRAVSPHTVQEFMEQSLAEALSKQSNTSQDSLLCGVNNQHNYDPVVVASPLADIGCSIRENDAITTSSTPTIDSSKGSPHAIETRQDSIIPVDSDEISSCSPTAHLANQSIRCISVSTSSNEDSSLRRISVSTSFHEHLPSSSPTSTQIALPLVLASQPTSPKLNSARVTPLIDTIIEGQGQCYGNNISINVKELSTEGPASRNSESSTTISQNVRIFEDDFTDIVPEAGKGSSQANPVNTENFPEPESRCSVDTPLRIISPYPISEPSTSKRSTSERSTTQLPPYETCATITHNTNPSSTTLASLARDLGYHLITAADYLTPPQINPSATRSHLSHPLLSLSTSHLQTTTSHTASLLGGLLSLTLSLQTPPPSSRGPLLSRLSTYLLSRTPAPTPAAKLETNLAVLSTSVASASMALSPSQELIFSAKAGGKNAETRLNCGVVRDSVMEGRVGSLVRGIESGVQIAGAMRNGVGEGMQRN